MAILHCTRLKEAFLKKHQWATLFPKKTFFSKTKFPGTTLFPLSSHPFHKAQTHVKIDKNQNGDCEIRERVRVVGHIQGGHARDEGAPEELDEPGGLLEHHHPAKEQLFR